MAKQKTRDERVEEKVKGGMSRVKAEIEVKREDMLAKLDALEEQERAQETRLGAKVVALLKEDEPDLYDRLHRLGEIALLKEDEPDIYERLHVRAEVALLENDEPDVYDRLRRLAEEALDKDREVRSRRSRESVKQSASKADAAPATSFVNPFGD
jgi:hypothetical protein